MLQEIIPSTAPKSYMLFPAVTRSRPSKAMAQKILELVCEFYDVDVNKVLSKQRYKPLCMARHITVHLLKKYTSMTLTDIGIFLGGRDHTTSINSLRQLSGWMENDETLVNQIEYLRSQIQLWH